LHSYLVMCIISVIDLFYLLFPAVFKC
jgi:hypothetical protein